MIELVGEGYGVIRFGSVRVGSMLAIVAGVVEVEIFLRWWWWWCCLSL